MYTTASLEDPDALSYMSIQDTCQTRSAFTGGQGTVVRCITSARKVDDAWPRKIKQALVDALYRTCRKAKPGNRKGTRVAL